MESLSGSREIAFLGDRYEIAKMPEFHFNTP